MKHQLTHCDLAQFSGSLERYQHPMNKQIIYTPGVRYLAEHGDAYWLIDAIASYFGTPVMRRAVDSDDRLGSLQFWRLDVSDDHSAVLSARADSGVKPFIIQHITFTDFPLDHADVWAGFDGFRWTLYLPSEH